MSVLIKGMDMPTETYAHCMLVKDINGDVQLYVCAKNSENISEWEYYDLVPVPPHGRLIDADTLIKQARTQFDFNDVVDVEDIMNAPTIIHESEEGE